MNYYNDKFKEIISPINKFLQNRGIKNPSIIIEKTARIDHGDISTNVAMRYAKELKTNPFLLATELTDYLNSIKNPFIKSVAVAKPGFINIYLAPNFYREILKDILKHKDSFGKGETHASETWVIEHTSPNPNKAMHIGHLRINLVGMSLASTIEWEGAHVLRDAVFNDRGISIAKVMYGFLAIMKKKELTPIDANYWNEHMDEWHTPAELELLPDVFITNCYIAGEKLASEDSHIDKIVRNMVILWEKEDIITWNLWRHVLNYSYEGINRTLKRIGNRWDFVWYEHEYYKKGKEYVAIGLKRGIFKKLPDGAILTNLEKYKIPDTIVLKSDGTALYLTQDIALTAEKKKKYKADRMIWVVGPEQSIALKQVFAVCEQLGIGKLEDFIHVTYGYVGLSDKDNNFQKMSSRKGNVVLIDDVIDTVKKKIILKITTDKKNIADPDSMAEIIAMGAIKFALLKSQKDTTIAFNIERSIDIKGDSGLYVLYTYSRIQSLIRKADEKGIKMEISELIDEIPVVPHLFWFHESIQRTTRDYSTHNIAQYLLELCGQFNNWYQKEIILDDSDMQSHKLAITNAVGIVLKNGLTILGIDTIERM